MRFFAFLLASAVSAQVPTNPVVPPRGVVNAFSRQPAPSVASSGGLIEISGLNLAAPVEVLVNNRAAQVLSAEGGKILAQVPPETPNGLAVVVVRKGEQTSRPARVQIQAVAPGLESANGLGFGPAAIAEGDGKTVLRATGLAEDGILLVDGLRSAAAIRPAPSQPGVFEIELGGLFRAGTPLVLAAANASSNVVTLGKGSATELSYIAFPPGTPELRSLRSSDARGHFLIAAGARGTDGCYPSFVLDARAATISPLEACPTAAQTQLLSPFVENVNGAGFAALEGPYTAPPPGVPPAPFSNKVWIVTASRDTPLAVALPEPVQNLNPGPGGTFIATGQGKAFVVDAESGEVSERDSAPVAGVVQNLVSRFQNIDLGDGLNRLLSAPVSLANQFVVTVGNAVDNPSRARVAVLNAQGEVATQRDFPEGWLPLTAPAPPAAPGNPPNPGAPNQTPFRLPVAVFADPGTRSYYVLAANGQGKHALVLFPPEGDARALALPEDWTFTACVANLPVFNLELARRVALLGSRTEERGFKNPCPADGYLLFDLATREISPVSLPGSGQLNASGGASELNDFLIGLNTDPARRNTADTLYVLDGVNATAYRFDLPAGVNNFSGLNLAPSLNLALSAANNRVAGDAGIVLFDLERTEAKLLPTPEGFVSVNFLGVLPGVRKLAARGVLAANAGAQILLYDLLTGDLEVVPNPEGVAWAGPVPQPAPTPGQPPQPLANVPIRVNAKANTIEALAHGADRRQRGVLVVRAH